MQNYRAGPVGPVGAHGESRGTDGRISEEREKGGGDKRARQHLNPPQLRA